MTAFNAKWGNYNTVTSLRLLTNGTKYTLTDMFIAMCLGVKKALPRTVLLFCYAIVFWLFIFTSIFILVFCLFC